MPFKSKQQQKWAFANHKPWAKKWAAVTDFKHLPDEVKKKQMGGVSQSVKDSWNQYASANSGDLDGLLTGYAHSNPGIDVNALRTSLQGEQARAKSFSARNYLVAGENANTGNLFPAYENHGAITPNSAPRLQTQVPDYVKSLEYNTQNNYPYYKDQNDDINYVPREYMNLPRFQQKRGLNLGATTNVRDIAKYQDGGMAPRDTTPLDHILNFTPITPTVLNPERTNITDRPGLPQDQFNPAMMLRGAGTAAAFFSGIMDRNRQNQYMYNQYSTLGQRDAMPAQDYQPNPYRLYSKFGGSLRRYQQGGTPQNWPAGSLRKPLIPNQYISPMIDEITYPGDTLTNNQIPYAARFLQHNPMMQSVTAKTRNSDVAGYSNWWNYTPSQKDLPKIKAYQDNMGLWENFKTGLGFYGSDEMPAPIPYKQMGGDIRDTYGLHAPVLPLQQAPLDGNSPSQTAANQMMSTWGPTAQALGQAHDSYLRTYNSIYNEGAQMGWSPQKISSMLRKGTAPYQHQIDSLQNVLPKKYQRGGMHHQGNHSPQVHRPQMQAQHTAPAAGQVQQQGQNAQIQQLIQQYAQMAGQDPQQIMQQIQQMPPQQQQQAIQKMAQMVQQSQGQQQDQQGQMKKGGWMKDAVNPDHKGYCTPMTKATCTPHRKAFAQMMKNKHGFHK